MIFPSSQAIFGVHFTPVIAFFSMLPTFLSVELLP
jgi:hypothetical protein